ncbi:MAG: M42 family metallopeptidase [Acholeplasmataceae bacterium]
MLKGIYEKLFRASGTSGHEQAVRAIMRAEMAKYPSFSIETDHLGSIFAVKRSKTKDPRTIMVAGHMDEVGLMVVGIKSNGMIEMQPTGGLVPEVLTSQVLDVWTEQGPIKGIVGAIPPHLRTEQKHSIADMVLDVGARSREEAKSFGIRPGDMVAFPELFFYTKDKRRVISKAIDNRYGCGLALETIAHFDAIELPFDLVVGATVQEEVGLRGAMTSVEMFSPDIFIALDASPLNDAIDDEAPGKLGQGFLLRIFDPRNVMHRKIRNYLTTLADRHAIGYQYYTSKGGTDAARALDMFSGIPATTIGLPARYIHSTAAMMDLDDLDTCRKMLFTLLETITVETIDNLKEEKR